MEEKRKQMFTDPIYALEYDNRWLKPKQLRARDFFFLSEFIAKIKNYDKVLDYGCGTGRWAVHLARKGTFTACIDIQKSMLSVLRGKLFKEHKKFVHLILCDGENLPIRDKVFDDVISYGALHHIPNVRRGLKEISRVLKPGGTLYGYEPREFSEPFIYLLPFSFKPLVRFIKKFFFPLQTSFKIDTKIVEVEPGRSQIVKIQKLSQNVGLKVAIRDFYYYYFLHSNFLRNFADSFWVYYLIVKISLFLPKILPLLKGKAAEIIIQGIKVNHRNRACASQSFNICFRKEATRYDFARVVYGLGCGGVDYAPKKLGSFVFNLLLLFLYRWL